MESSKRQAFRHYQGVLVDALVRNGGWGYTPQEGDGKHRAFDLRQIAEKAGKYAKQLIAQEDEFMSASTEAEESN